MAAFDEPLFDEDVEAWMYGPVVPCVYDEYSKYGSDALPKTDCGFQLTEEEEILFNEVYDAFRDFSAIGLMNRTHSEDTWKEVLPHNRGTVITKEAMRTFFKTKMQ